MTEAERELAKRVAAAIYEMATTGKSVRAQTIWLQTISEKELTHG